MAGRPAACSRWRNRSRRYSSRPRRPGIMATPDLVLPIGTGHTVTSGSPFEIKRFVVATNLAAAKRVRAIALKQGDRRVVRHAAFYDEATGRWLGALDAVADAVDVRRRHRPFCCPQARKIAVEIGYSGARRRCDRHERARSCTSLTANGPVADAMSISAPEWTAARRYHGSARAHRNEARGRHNVRRVVARILARRATSVEITATTPEGIVTPLLWINDYRPEWRSPFILAAPVTLPRGTRW